VRWKEAVGDGNGARTAVGWLCDDSGWAGRLAQVRRNDDGIATGRSDDPAARFDVFGVFFIRGLVGVQGADVFIQGRGNKKEEFCSVIVPLGRRILYERGASP
jgi:hypothetical protein